MSNCIRDEIAMRCPISIEYFFEHYCNSEPTLQQYTDFIYRYADAMMKSREIKMI